jgi:transcriptional regulator with XRE-family HTH domain
MSLAVHLWQGVLCRRQQGAPAREQAMSRKQTKAQRAGLIARERRELLGMTQADVSAAGGPSPVTLRAIENGTASHFRPYTVAALEQALSWPRGTFKQVLDGGDPPSDEPPPVNRTPPPTDTSTTAQLRAMQQQLETLLRGTNPTPTRRDTSPAAMRSIRVSDALWVQVMAEADDRGVPASEVVRDALRDRYVQVPS